METQSHSTQQQVWSGGVRLQLPWVHDGSTSCHSIPCVDFCVDIASPLSHIAGSSHQAFHWRHRVTPRSSKCGLLGSGYSSLLAPISPLPLVILGLILCLETGKRSNNNALSLWQITTAKVVPQSQGLSPSGPSWSWSTWVYTHGSTHMSPHTWVYTRGSQQMWSHTRGYTQWSTHWGVNTCV